MVVFDADAEPGCDEVGVDFCGGRAVDGNLGVCGGVVGGACCYCGGLGGVWRERRWG